jgi:hypothetical protein
LAAIRSRHVNEARFMSWCLIAVIGTVSAVFVFQWIGEVTRSPYQRLIDRQLEEVSKQQLRGFMAWSKGNRVKTRDGESGTVSDTSSDGECYSKEDPWVEVNLDSGGKAVGSKSALQLRKIEQ